MSILENFPHECTILKMDRRRDSLGGSSDISVPVQTGVKCWQQGSSNTSSTPFQKRGISDTRRIYFTDDPNVTERHVIKVTKRNGVTQTNPVEFSVDSEATPDASAGLAVIWRVEVHDVSTGTHGKGH